MGGEYFMYDFDKKVNRKNSNSVKWDEIGSKFISDELLPMWVADMDFETAPEILEAMRKKLDEKIFGYVYRPATYYKSAVQWTFRRHNYNMSTETLTHSPGVVPSLSLILRLFTSENDKVIIQTPVYYPFANVIRTNNRTLVTNKLKEEAGKYSINFEDFEKKCEDPEVKWFILSNPHNPVGRVWTREELEKLADICLRNNVRVIADEIWRDLVYKNHKFTHFASISKEVEDITITCFAASKTFNIAGLQASFISFPRKEELMKFEHELGVLDITRNNPFSIVATEAAFNKGEPWLEELLNYLEGNLDYLVDYMRINVPKVKVIKPEGTYLAWLDFRDLKLTNEELSKLLQEQGKIALDDGFWFGEDGGGFARMNIACPKYILEDGLKRIKTAVDSIG